MEALELSLAYPVSGLYAFAALRAFLRGLKPPSRGKAKIGNEINDLKVFFKNMRFFLILISEF